MSDETVLGTITGDHFQPVRLHYRVLQPKNLMRAFAKLRCVARDPTQDRWVWLYDFEARKLRFKQSYTHIPAHLRPIIIGSFYLRAQNQLLLDLRSCERAIHAVEFFDKHIPRKVAQVEEAEVVNKLFPTRGNLQLTPADLFDHQPSTRRDPDEDTRRMLDLLDKVQEPEEKFRIALADCEARAKLPLPEIERFPVHIYEEGIYGFITTLRLRQIVALQHWLGNTAFTILDAIQQSTPGSI